MSIFNEHDSNSESDISSTVKQGPSSIGFKLTKLTDTGDYDLQNKIKNC